MIILQERKAVRREIKDQSHDQLVRGRMSELLCVEWSHVVDYLFIRWKGRITVVWRERERETNLIVNEHRLVLWTNCYALSPSPPLLSLYPTRSLLHEARDTTGLWILAFSREGKKMERREWFRGSQVRTRLYPPVPPSLPSSSTPPPPSPPPSLYLFSPYPLLVDGICYGVAVCEERREDISGKVKREERPVKGWQAICREGIKGGMRRRGVSRGHFPLHYIRMGRWKKVTEGRLN